MQEFFQSLNNILHAVDIPYFKKKHYCVGGLGGKKLIKRHHWENLVLDKPEFFFWDASKVASDILMQGLSGLWDEFKRQ